MRPFVNVVVEGDLDEAVARRLISHVGAETGYVYGRRGKGYVEENIGRFNHAARNAPWLWFVLVDLDDDYECAPRLCRDWLADAAPNLCLRVAVREVEAWLLADREAAARFLAVAEALVPPSPESEADPKRVLVELARRSRRRDIREDLVPRPGSGLEVGPAYEDRLIEFVRREWRPEMAAHTADSLRRCLSALGRLVQTARPGPGYGA